MSDCLPGWEYLLDDFVFLETRDFPNGAEGTGSRR